MEYNYYKYHNIKRSLDLYKDKGLCGILNPGNYCFLTSILICLFNNIKLTDYLLLREFKTDDKEHLFSKKKETLFLNSYINILESYWNKTVNTNIKTFINKLSEFNIAYKNNTQEDSHEALILILELLHKSISYKINVNISGEVLTECDMYTKQSYEQWSNYYSNGYSYIIEMFNGNIMKNIKCTNCDYKNNLFEQFMILDVECNSDTLIECIKESYIKSEKIDSWECEECKNKSCEKTTSVWTLPNYLIIKLNRFNIDKSKNDKMISFDIGDIDLTELISTKKQDDNNYIYEIYAINYHIGDHTSGHYYSTYKNLNKNWYLHNDGNTTKYFNNNEMINNNAYMFFLYRKFISV